MYCEHPIKAGEGVLHVSDLINNAVSFFDHWQPALGALKLECSGNLCVTIRGEIGLKRLKQAGQKTFSLVTIDVDFFRLLHAADLIDQATFEEIAVFFASSQDWAAKYLIGKPELLDVGGCDAKSFERLRNFIVQDPWKLQPKHQAFFTNMRQAIDQRMSKAA
jgi:hypothetical protein